MLNKLGSQFERPTMTQPGCQYDIDLSKFELFGHHVDIFLFTNINMINISAPKSTMQLLTFVLASRARTMLEMSADHCIPLHVTVMI